MTGTTPNDDTVWTPIGYGCTGDYDCQAPVHIEGCYATDPNEPPASLSRSRVRGG